MKVVESVEASVVRIVLVYGIDSKLASLPGGFRVVGGGRDGGL